MFAEAINEKSLTGAGLNFPINAYYHKKVDQTKHNVTSYEIILGDISQFAILIEAGVALEKIYSYGILLLRKGYLRASLLEDAKALIRKGFGLVA